MNAEHENASSESSFTPEEILLEAERLFASELERIAESFPMKEEHLEDLRKNTTFRLGRDDLNELEERKQESEEAGRKLTTTFSGKVLKMYLTLAGKRAEWEELISRNQRAAKRYQEMIDECSSWSFSYDPEGSDITIYPLGERKITNQRSFSSGIMAELGHAVIMSAGSYREGEFQLHEAVSEFYDIAFQMYKFFDMQELSSEELEGLDSTLLIMRFADYYHVGMERYGSVGEAAYHAATTMCAPLSDDFDFMGLFQLVHTHFEVFAASRPEHSAALALAIRLMPSMSRETGLALEELLPHLMTVAMSALYDPEVDFSSPEGFVETVIARLPEYLKW